MSQQNIPDFMKEAFDYSKDLTESQYTPPLIDNFEADGTRTVYVSVDSKALLFFDYCKRNNLNGRIVNDEVLLHPMGDFVLVEAKAYVYIEDVMKGSGAAGQSFQIGQVADMDFAIQSACGLAKSRALSNAGFGIVSQFKFFPQNFGSFDSQGDSGSSDSQQSSKQNPHNATGNTAAGKNTEADRIAWAKSVTWPREKRTMGQILATEPGKIKWVWESMSGNGEVKQAAGILYPEACRLLGIPQK